MKLINIFEEEQKIERDSAKLEKLSLSYLEELGYSVSGHSSSNDSKTEDITIDSNGKTFKIDVKMLKANGGSRKINDILPNYVDPKTVKPEERLGVTVSNFVNYKNGTIQVPEDRLKLEFLDAKFAGTDFFMTKVGNQFIIFDYPFLRKNAKLNTNLVFKSSGSSDSVYANDDNLKDLLVSVFGGKFEIGRLITSDGEIIKISSYIDNGKSRMRVDLTDSQYDKLVDFFNNNDKKGNLLFTVIKKGNEVQYQINNTSTNKRLGLSYISSGNNLHVFYAKKLFAPTIKAKDSKDTVSCWIDLTDSADELIKNKELFMRKFEQTIKNENGNKVSESDSVNIANAIKNNLLSFANELGKAGYNLSGSEEERVKKAGAVNELLNKKGYSKEKVESFIAKKNYQHNYDKLISKSNPLKDSNDKTFDAIKKLIQKR